MKTVSVHTIVVAATPVTCTTKLPEAAVKVTVAVVSVALVRGGVGVTPCAVMTAVPALLQRPSAVAVMNAPF